MKRNQVVYILAGNYSQYKAFITKYRLDMRTNKYISSAESICGLRDVIFIRIGSWDLRTYKEITEINLMVQSTRTEFSMNAKWTALEDFKLMIRI